MKNDTLRTFIAFPITEGLIEKISAFQQELKKLRLDAKWVNPKSIHLTVKFLGETPVSSLKEIEKKIEEIAKRHSSFSVAIDTFGIFPNLRSPRVLWVGSKEGTPEGDSFAQTLEETLEALGFKKEERPFKPHLTLARLRSLLNEKALSEFAEKYELPWKEILPCQTLIHYQSTLTPKGALYEPLYAVPLRGEAEVGG